MAQVSPWPDEGRSPHGLANRAHGWRVRIDAGHGAREFVFRVENTVLVVARTGATGLGQATAGPYRPR